MRFLKTLFAAATLLASLCASASAAEGLLTFRVGPYIPENGGHGDVWLDLGVDSAPIPAIVPFVGGFNASADILVGDGAQTLSLTLNRRFSIPRVIPSMPGLYVSIGGGWYRMDAGDVDDNGLGYRLAAGVVLSKYTIEASYNAASLGEGLDPDGLGLTLGFRF